jgi:1-acyl-sn-glycerol-3-phosphate acyltransferase
MSQSKLLRDRRFAPLFWTQFFGAFNDNFLKNAIVLLITFRSGEIFGFSPSEMVVVSGGIFILPFFLFSAIAGQVADKYEKAKVIRVIKVCEIGIMALAAAGFLTAHFPLLLTALFLMGVHSAFFGPIKYSILPQQMDETELVGANALIEAGTFLAILLGTIGGGVLVSLANGPLVVSALLIAFAGIGYFKSRGVPAASAADNSITIGWNVWRPTVEILRVTRSNHAVYLSILGASWFWFFGASMLSLFPTYAKETLHANESVVTLLLACFSMGIGLGSLLCEKLSKGRIELGLVPFGSIGISVFTLDLFFRGSSVALGDPDGALVGALDMLTHVSSARVLVDLVFIAVFSGFFIVPLYANIQERSAPAVRSRVIAGNNILNSIFMVASAIMLFTLLKMGVAVPTLFLILSALNALVSIYIYTLLPEFLFRFLSWILSNIMYKLTVNNAAHVPKTGAAIIAANHVSFVDWMILSAAVLRPMSFVMHESYLGGPILRLLMKRARVIPIASAKEKPEVLESAMNTIAERLSAGELICIFPEGTITKTGELSTFKPGIERIVARTPVPVIPAALSGMWGSFFSRKYGRAMSGVPRRIHFPVSVTFSEPIAAKDVSASDLLLKVGEML